MPRIGPSRKRSLSKNRGPFSLSVGGLLDHNGDMQRRGFQLSVTGMIGLVAAIAVNVWLFKVSILLGIVGLNVTKHVAIAYLCQVLGVGRRNTPAPPPAPVPGLPVH